MKTYTSPHQLFVLTLVIVLIVFSVQGISYGQNLNVGEPRTVRMIYFLPNDLPYRADVVQKMKDEIRTVQTFYGEQMVAHGYGNKTFQFERDNRGEPLVHLVDGQHAFSHYDNTLGNAVLYELNQTYDLNSNIYFIVFGTDFLNQGNGRPAIGVGRRLTKNGGYALVANEFSWKWIAHELGHAFGLLHDFRDDSYVLSYGRQDQLSACTADFLSVHPYFNSAIPIAESSLPIIKPISPSAYPTGLKSVPIHLIVFDEEGLHQVFLYVERELKACKTLAGERDTVVEFEYDGLIPSEGSTDLYDPNVHEFQAMVVDIDGNIKSSNFKLAALSPQHHNTFEHENPFTSATFSPVDMTIASGSWRVSGRVVGCSRRGIYRYSPAHALGLYCSIFTRWGNPCHGIGR